MNQLITNDRRPITNQRGQAVIILLLIMVVALAIGLAITQRSVSDLTTSNQSDQAARAFSAAEAGIEKAITSGSLNVSELELGNQSSATVKVVADLPKDNQAIEYPPIGKETVAQFWLANPDTLAPYYVQNKVNLYFGDTSETLSNSDIPAIEVNLITRTAGVYKANRFYYDPIKSSRAADNGFIPVSCTPRPAPINTLLSPSNSLTIADRQFRCKVTIDIPAGDPILVRARILYSNIKHPVALAPVSGSLPKQISIYTSKGNSGQTEKIIQVFKQKNVAPAFLDFTIFSVGEISKN